MIVVSAGTLLAVLAILVTIVLAALGALWKLAVQMGEFRSTLDGLTAAVERWADLAERVAALEALGSGHPYRQNRLQDRSPARPPVLPPEGKPVLE